MSQREVAMNSNWKHGDILCGSCNAAGAHGVLKPARCATCGRPTCFVCRGASDERKEHDQVRFCAPKVKGRK